MADFFFPAKLGMNKSAIGFDDLLCLARWAGQSTTLLDLMDLICPACFNQLNVMAW